MIRVFSGISKGDVIRVKELLGKWLGIGRDAGDVRFFGEEPLGRTFFAYRKFTNCSGLLGNDRC